MRLPAAVFVLAAACSGGGGSPTVPPDTTSASGCDVVLRAARAETRGTAIDVTVVVENRGDRALELELANRCPLGVIDFTGLPEGYDYYDGCAKGACLEHPPVRIGVARGETRELEALTIDTAGHGCNGPLAPGAYELRPVPAGFPAGTCVEGLTIDVPSAAKPPAPAPAPDPPKPAPAASNDLRACSSSADCTIYCPEVKGCCGMSACGCRNAIRRDRRADFEAAYAKSCQRTPNCPVVGCAYEPADSARCENGRCVAVDGLGGP
jgi:hypothetical protein